MTTTRLLIAAYLALALLFAATGIYLRVTPPVPDYPTLGNAWEPVKPRHYPHYKYYYIPLYEGLTYSKSARLSDDWLHGAGDAGLPRAPHYSTIGGR